MAIGFEIGAIYEELVWPFSCDARWIVSATRARFSLDSDAGIRRFGIGKGQDTKQSVAWLSRKKLPFPIDLALRDYSNCILKCAGAYYQALPLS